jgi:Ser/Thr protein kinase RdoA (MazF antagonist)
VSDSAYELLSGGNVADRVLRVGMTVRKPSTKATNSIETFLKYLHAKGFAGAPRTLGRDDQGRQVLEYVPGSTITQPHLLSRDELYRVGRLIREFHDAAQDFVPPASAEWNVAIKADAESMVCHHDLAPWNLVRDGDRWVFIDWDGCGPGSLLWDLAYASQSFVPLAEGGNAAEDSVRLRFLIDGYGLDTPRRNRLPEMMVDRTWAMHRLLEDGARTGAQPWARLYAEGHGTYWRKAAAYVERHLNQWKTVLLQRQEP